jgi:hypothetical protein
MRLLFLLQGILFPVIQGIFLAFQRHAYHMMMVHITDVTTEKKNSSNSAYK